MNACDRYALGHSREQSGHPGPHVLPAETNKGLYIQVPGRDKQTQPYQQPERSIIAVAVGHEADGVKPPIAC